MFKLKNKFIFALVKNGYGDKNGNVTEKHLNFYSRRSGDAGLVILEPLFMDKGLRELPTQMGIDDDDKISGLKKLTDTIHSKGSKAGAHLNHPGRMVNPKIPGNYFVSSTDKPCEAGGATPKALTRPEIIDIVKMFVAAAKRAEKAGFDVIELQFGHGYLVAQFLSPAVNNRSDVYGGSFENRSRIAREIFTAVKGAVKLPIVVRISGSEMTPDGFQIEETLEFAKNLESWGADALHVVAGTLCSNPPWFFQHMFLPKGKTWEFAAAVKKQVSIPVIAVGRVSSKEDVDKITNEMGIDYVAAGRALVADPDFFGKISGAIDGLPKPCMACSEGCLGGVKAGKGLRCIVNPVVGRDVPELKAGGTNSRGKIAVVGSGVAGMETAINLKRKGYDVTLFEKDTPGGQFNLASMTPHKKALSSLVPWYKTEIERLKIPLVKKEVVPEDIKGKYEACFIATGSRPTKLNIEGLDSFVWAEILMKENLPSNKNILIIGGGMIGVDVATALLAKQNRVTIVKRSENFGEDMEMIAKKLSLKIIRDKGGLMWDHTQIEKVNGGTVYGKRNGESFELNNIDLIVVTAGMESVDELKISLKESGLDVITVGDAHQVGNVQSAIYDAFDSTVNY